MEKVENFEDLVNLFLDVLDTHYWRPIMFVLENKKELKRTFPTFIICPEKIHVYLGKNHIAVEYFGAYNGPIQEKENAEIVFFDYSEFDNFIETIIGIEFGENPLRLPLSGTTDDLFVATVEATRILAENNWNFLAQEMMFMMHAPGLYLDDGFTRIRNSFFYEKNGDGLRVRNIKWLDIFPLERKALDEEIEELSIAIPDLNKIASLDVHYSIPEKLNFQYDKLIILNRFIELYNSEGVLETDITRFLSQPDNQFIIKMAFFGTEVYSEKECEWADNSNRKAIRPDFFVSGPNGYADIVEFKLPTIKTATAIVGRENRESFSSEINSYISQTRVYKAYFEDPRNREYVKNNYNINVYYPKRYLIIGRRWMFEQEIWRAIENDYGTLTIRTYDDIVDTVMGFLMS